MSRKIADVIWLALQYAKSDRRSLVDAYHSDESQEAVKDALADIKAFEKLQFKLFGTTRSRGDAIIDKMKSVDLFELITTGELWENDELFVDLHK